MDELIRKQDALDAIHCNITVTGRQNAELVAATIGAFVDRIKALPPVQPTITYEQAIDYLRETGWLQNHDRILTESKIVPPVQGEWIDTETSYADGVQQKCQCSVCKLLSPRPLGDFCRWCGADMRGGKNGTD